LAAAQKLEKVVELRNEEKLSVNAFAASEKILMYICKSQVRIIF